MSVLIGLLGAYEQWGITPELTFNSTTTITYSLPLATTLYINAFMYGGGFDKCVQLPQILSQTSTSAQIYITWATDSARYYGSVTWLAIGKQQWGVVNSYRVTVTFPLAYTKLYCLNAYMTASSTSTIDLYSRNVTLKTFDIVASVPDDEFASFDMAFWLSLGI